MLKTLWRIASGVLFLLVGFVMARMALTQTLLPAVPLIVAIAMVSVLGSRTGRRAVNSIYSKIQIPESTYGLWATLSRRSSALSLRYYEYSYNIGAMFKRLVGARFGYGHEAVSSTRSSILAFGH